MNYDTVLHENLYVSKDFIRVDQDYLDNLDLEGGRLRYVEDKILDDCLNKILDRVVDKVRSQMNGDLDNYELIKYDYARFNYSEFDYISANSKYNFVFTFSDGHSTYRVYTEYDCAAIRSYNLDSGNDFYAVLPYVKVVGSDYVDSYGFVARKYSITLDK